MVGELQIAKMRSRAWGVRRFSGKFWTIFLRSDALLSIENGLRDLGSAPCATDTGVAQSNTSRATAAKPPVVLLVKPPATGVPRRRYLRTPPPRA